MSPRFFCANISGESADLDESESHHAIHVLRLNVGDAVELFDGSGLSASARIVTAGRRTVSTAIEQTQADAPLQRPRLIVAASPPRGDRLKSMVEKLTELGVDEFIPLRTVRSVVDPRQSKLDKLRGTVIGAMKQCGRNRLMVIHEPAELSVTLRLASSLKQSICVAHPSDSQQEPAQTMTGDTLLLIGPEGGFTREEVLQATDYGARRIAWPEGILRIETATIAFATLLLARLHNSR